jgi:hypothetical protein
VLAVPQESKGGAQPRIHLPQGLVELLSDFCFGVTTEKSQLQRVALGLGHLVESSLKKPHPNISQGYVLRARHPDLRRRGEE